MGRARRSHSPPPAVEGPLVRDALGRLDAETLRRILDVALGLLDPRERAVLERRIIEQAARGHAGWPPVSASRAVLAAGLEAARDARRRASADPEEVDAHLSTAANAFLAREYGGARSLFEAWLGPIGDGDVDLGQDEMVDEVLGADLSACAARLLVSVYMTTAPEARARDVLAALETTWGVGSLFRPLGAMERAAVEPLPDFPAFIADWHTLLEGDPEPRGHTWGHHSDWRREAALRLEGAAGLADLARATRKPEDLKAWCAYVVEQGDSPAALAAYEEAACLVEGASYERADFLDGAAACAMELGRRHVAQRLERAWRCDPTLERLARWLGAAESGAALKKRARAALAACPAKARRQRVFLHLLLGEVVPAAKLLASAPGLGWSGAEHPGHLLVPLFESLLRGQPLEKADLARCRTFPGYGAFEDEADGCEAFPYGDLEDSSPYELPADPLPGSVGPCLSTPSLGDLLARASRNVAPGPAERDAVLRSLRKAAERRLAGLTEHQRRRHYGHAASIVGLVASLDASPATQRWVAELREAYRRYPALRREFDHHLPQA